MCEWLPYNILAVASDVVAVMIQEICKSQGFARGGGVMISFTDPTDWSKIRYHPQKFLSLYSAITNLHTNWK